MAQLGLGAAGAAIGFFATGGTMVGAQIGFALGSLAGGAIDQAMQKPIQGPRLSDLSVSSSAYGNAIPEIQGTVRLAGNVIWSTGLLEDSKTTGGKGTPKQELYSYKASFAASFCRGPTARVLRIWLDKKLAYDATASGEAIGVKGLVWRFYSGSEVQLPDRAVVAKDGANAPAHRGTCYIVFDSVPLEVFGNRVPNIEAEITTDAAEVDITTAVTNLAAADGNPFSSPTHESTWPAVDWERRIALRAYQQSGTYGIGVADITSGVETQVKTVAEMHDGTVFSVLDSRATIVGISPGSHAYYALGGVVRTPLVRFDPYTLTVTAQHANGGASWSDDRVDQLTGCANISTTRILSEGDPRQIVLVTSIYGFVRIIDGDTMESLWGMTGERTGQPAIVDKPDFPFIGVQTYQSVSMVGGEQRLAETDVWLLTSGSTSASGTTDEKKPRLQRVRLGVIAGFAEAFGQSPGVRYETVARLDPGTIHPDATVVSVSGLQYDPADNCLVFVSRQVSGSGDTLRLVKIDETGTLVWTTKILADPGIPAGQARLDGTIYAALNNATGQIIDLRSGTVQTFSNSTGTNGYALDGETRSIARLVHPRTMQRIYFGRATPNPVPLADVVTWLCLKAGLAEAEIDVSLLSGDVRGFVRGQEPIRDSLAVLQAAYFFDVVEEDDVLRFRPRGGSTVASIAYADVLRREADQPAITIRQADDTELPRRLWVDYRDVGKDQQSNAMAWSRALSPTVMVNGRRETRLNLSALVLTASEAKTIAMRHLLASYAERFVIENLGLTYQHLALNAADAVTLELSDGTTQRVAFRRGEIGADYTAAVEAVFEDASIYTMETTGSSGDGHVVQTVPSSYPTRLLWANLPLLDERDDAGGVGLRFYAAAGGNGAGWLGAALFTSADLATWDRVETLRTGMVWGTALNTLAAPGSAFATDRTNSLRVAMMAGAADVEDATELEMLNGANRAVLICADGSAELIAFSDVTVNGDGSLTLSTLLRGQRGTEWACAGHAPGDLFVLVNDAFQDMILPLGALGGTRYARAVGRFDVFDAVAASGRTITGAAEKPFAPVSIAGSRDGGGNLTVTWVRRTRIGGEWLDGTEDAPLGEDSEAYEVDVMSGGTVVRTISGLTAASASYSAANQATDFGSAQAAIAVRVYQISATVGRGYAGSATV